MHRWGKIALFIGIGLVVAGCPKGRTNFNQGRKAQNLQDYDAAFEYYQIKRSLSCSEWTKSMVKPSFRQRVNQTRQERAARARSWAS